MPENFAALFKRTNYIFFLLFSFQAYSQTFVGQLEGSPLIGGQTLIVNDQALKDADASDNSDVRLELQLFSDGDRPVSAGEYEMGVEVRYWLEGDNYDEDAQRTKNFNLAINADGAGGRKPLLPLEIQGSRRLEVEVQYLRFNDGPLPVEAPSMRLIAEVSIPPPACPLDVTAVLSADFFDSTDEVTDSVAIVGFVECAVEYDFEYAFYDEDSREGKMLAASSAGNPELDDLFRHNATRLTSSLLQFRVFGLYRKGYIVARYRAVSYEDGMRIHTRWSGQGRRLYENGNRYTGVLEVSHQPEYNWQATTNFAEEAKQLPAVSYLDGTMRGRQNLVLQYGESNGDPSPGTEFVIGQQRIYDAMGRPAVSVLPAPIYPGETVTHPLRFDTEQLARPLGSTTDDAPYGKVQVEAAGECGAEAMSGAAGAGKFYSPANSRGDSANAFVADGQGYPFAVTRYTPDNTGRVRRQGGVGPQLQVGDHDTRYYYGKPNQWELDRLFGVNVGKASHYQKTMVIDPNGQATVSYLDSKGRTVATALAGRSPDNLIPVKQVMAGFSYEVDPADTSGLTYTFTDLSRASGSVRWHFAELDSTEVSSPSFTFPEVGTYLVCQTASGLNEGGYEDRTCQYVRVVPTPQLLADTLYLDAGLNLISFDVAPMDRRITTLFADLLASDNLAYVQVRDSLGGLKIFNPALSEEENALTTLEVGWGYMVGVFNADTLFVAGTELNADFRPRLHAGVNLLAYLPRHSSTPADFFDFLPTGALTFARSFSDGRFHTYRPNFDSTAVPFNLKNGRAYEVFLTDSVDGDAWVDRYSEESLIAEGINDGYDPTALDTTGLDRGVLAIGDENDLSPIDADEPEPLSGNPITVKIDGNVRYDDYVEASYSLLVSERGRYDLCYALEAAEYASACCPRVPGDPEEEPNPQDTIASEDDEPRAFMFSAALAGPPTVPDCFECFYDVTISITPSAGCAAAIGTDVPRIIELNQIQLFGIAGDCFASDTLNNLILDVGEYHVTKTVRLNEEKVSEARKEFLEDSPCVPSEGYFTGKYLDSVDISGCLECDCSLPAEDISADCADYCRFTSPCEVLRTQMEADLYPGGQYARYEAVADENGEVVDYRAVATDEKSIFALEDGEPIFRRLLDIDLTATDFVEDFDPAWLPALLTYHPERYLLEYCESSIDFTGGNHPSSHFFNNELLKVEGYTDAAGKYAFGGAALTGPGLETAIDALVADDPYFTYPDHASLASDFKQSLHSNAEERQNLSYLMDAQLADLFGETWTWPVGAALAYQRDIAWRLLRDLYLSRKALYVEKQQIQYASNPSNFATDFAHGSGWQCLDRPLANNFDLVDLTDCTGSDYADYTARMTLASLMKISQAGVPASTDELLNEAPYAALTAAAADTLAVRRATNCLAYAPLWRDELTACGSFDSTTVETIIAELMAICATGVRGENPSPYGTSTVPAGVEPPNGYRSFAEVIAAYLPVDSTKCSSGDCHEYTINFPPPADYDYYGGTLTVASGQAAYWLVSNRAFLESRLRFLRDDCPCNTCEGDGGGGGPLPPDRVAAMAELNRMSVADLDHTLRVIEDFINGQTTGLFPTGDLAIPAELNGGGRYCVTRTVLENRYDMEVCDTLPDAERNARKASYLNGQLGWNRPWSDYALLLDSARTCMICAEPPAADLTVTEPLSCEAEALARAEREASFYYPAYVDGLAADFERKYRDHCLSNLEDQLLLRYTPHEYHYTLYYYDQAGNLAMTVPPDGVEPLAYSQADSLAIDGYRNEIVESERPDTDHHDELLPDHRLLTHYVYNNFDEVTLSDAPDKYPARTWYDAIGRAVLSRDGRQDFLGRVSYTLYDVLGRPTEVGETGDDDDLESLVAAARGGYLTALLGDTLYSVTRTYYTASPIGTGEIFPTGLSQRNRVAATTFTEKLLNNDPFDYDFASHYDYDVGGNVRTLVQDFAELDALAQRFKVLEYDYDLISGNVHNLYYQRGKADQFTYHYEYDKLNRLIGVASSEIETDHSRSNLWKRDAAYLYYDHGPLRRTVMGQEGLQGLDYAYTLQGWIKGVNGSLGDDYADVARPDLNHDGLEEAPYSAVGVAHRDLYRYANQYFHGDYTPIGGGANPAMDAVLPPYYELFNGNIVRHYKSTLADSFRTVALVGEYDQLNRLRYGTQATYGASGGGGAPEQTSLQKAIEAPAYDGNGNILHLTRSFATDAGTGAVNRLNYGYLPGTNLLTEVSGHAAGDRRSDDWRPFDFIDGKQRYAYDKSGNLIRETTGAATDGGTTLTWNPYGKVTTVELMHGKRTTFGYGPDQNRWAKRRESGEEQSTTYYVRDAQGSTLATYAHQQSSTEETFNWQQQYLYGSSRLGEVEMNRDLLAGTSTPDYGDRRYELTNHLGNVTTVFGEGIKSYTDGAGVQYTVPTLVGHEDYLAFGLGLERFEKESVEGKLNYRYAFNGKEKDDEGEWGLGTTAYDYGFRIYNPAIARFLSVDPLYKDYSAWSPFSYSMNSPLLLIDPDGRSVTSTHTNENGDVVAVYDDDDNGVYMHQNLEGINYAGTDSEQGVKLSSLDGYKMGETRFWDEFLDDEGAIIPNTRIMFNATWDYTIADLHEKSLDMDLIEMSENSKNGQLFSIQDEYGPEGRLLGGYYASSRSAGNYLAGLNASTGTYLGQSIFYDDFQRLAGALHHLNHLDPPQKLTKFDAFKVLLHLETYGEFPLHGETMYQYRWSIRGWRDGDSDIIRQRYAPGSNFQEHHLIPND